MAFLFNQFASSALTSLKTRVEAVGSGCRPPFPPLPAWDSFPKQTLVFSKERGVRHELRKRTLCLTLWTPRSLGKAMDKKQQEEIGIDDLWDWGYCCSQENLCFSLVGQRMLQPFFPGLVNAENVILLCSPCGFDVEGPLGPRNGHGSYFCFPGIYFSSNTPCFAFLTSLINFSLDGLSRAYSGLETGPLLGNCTPCPW